MPPIFVAGHSRIAEELGRALGVTMPFSALSLEVRLDRIVSATVTFPVEAPAMEAATEVVRRYRLQLAEEPEAGPDDAPPILMA